MKSLALMAFAATAAFAPLAAAPAFADYRDHGRYERRHDYDNRDDRRDERRAHRQGYREGRWDSRAHNGYYYNRAWHWGPPPSAYYGRPGFEVGYRAWRRGDRLPGYYRDHVRVIDYRGHRGLYAPPRGYHWVRDDRGDYLLVGITTGLILGALLSD